MVYQVIEASQASYDDGIDKATGLMQAQATSVPDFLAGIDPNLLETASIPKRPTMKSMAEAINFA